MSHKSGIRKAGCVSLVMTSLLLTSACGVQYAQKKPGNEGSGKASSSFASTTDDALMGSVIDPTIGSNLLSNEILTSGLARAKWKEISAAEATSASGFLSVARGTSAVSSADKFYQFDVRIGYGQVARIAARAIKSAAILACAQGNLPHEADLNRYFGGEIPCGNISDETWKHMHTVDVPEYRQKSSGFDIKADPVQLPIYMSRKARQGVYTEASLDNRGNAQKLSSTEFGNDVSMRYTPDGTQAKLDVCINLPGVDFMVPDRNVHASVKREIWFWKPSISSDFKVSLGKVSYDYVRSCFTSSVKIDPHTLAPQLDLRISEAPKFSNPQMSPMKIEIKDFWAQMINDVAEFFRFNFRKMIAQRADQEFANISENELQNGHWINRFNTEKIFKETTDRINQELAAQFKDRAILTKADQVRQRLRDRCKVIKSVQRAGVTLDEFVSKCESIVDGLDISVSPFNRDSDMAAKGCYDYFAPINESLNAGGTRKWWDTECAFSVKVQIRMPADSFKLVEDFKRFVAVLDLPLRLPVDLQNALQELRELAGDWDQTILPRLLQELERRGISDPTLDDLVRYLPDLVREIRL